MAKKKRPTKWGAPIRRALCAAMERTGSNTQASKAVGLHTGTLYRWFDAYPTFRDEMELARDRFYKRLGSGITSVVLQQVEAAAEGKALRRSHTIKDTTYTPGKGNEHDDEHTEEFVDEVPKVPPQAWSAVLRRWDPKFMQSRQDVDRAPVPSRP